MANTKSAKKQARRNVKRKQINFSRMSDIKTAVKKVLNALTQKVEEKDAKNLFLEATQKIARAQGKGLLHRNTASRKISRLAKHLNSAYKAA